MLLLEDIFKSPDAVSIVLSSATPIRTLSIVAPPLASICPVNVVVLANVATPVTLKLSSTSTKPPLESRINLPSDV